MITVIMPCYILNEALLHLTDVAIRSLGACHLLIIDNGSLIGGGFLRSKADLYIRNTENLGYAKAVNQGLKLATPGLIAVANNDVVVSENWQVVAQEVLSEPKAYSCHFRMFSPWETPTTGKSVVYTGKERWCTSSFFVIRSAHPLLYDEHFLNSYDDWDYWLRVRDQGYHTAYTDKAWYIHHHSTTQQLMPDREEQNQKNRDYFIEKWGHSAEDLFAEKYPDQMNADYQKGFEL